MYHCLLVNQNQTHHVMRSKILNEMAAAAPELGLMP